jgi:hypothetical protein
MKIMEKLLISAAVITALAFAACGGTEDEGGDSDSEAINLAVVFNTTESAQEKATVTVSGSNVTFAKDDSEMWGELTAGGGVDFSKYSGFAFEYKATANATIFIQDGNAIFILATAGDGWGAVSSQADWTRLDLPFSIAVNQGWFGDGTAPFAPSTVVKFCVQITAGGIFEIRNFSGVLK